MSGAIVRLSCYSPRRPSITVPRVDTCDYTPWLQDASLALGDQERSTSSSVAAVKMARAICPSCSELLPRTRCTGLETWEWDGLNWLLRTTGGFPARRDFELVFDRARNVTLLFGGNAGGSPGYADLWQWDGQTWTLIYIGGPTPRWNTAMVYDEQRQTVLLFGGWGEWQGNQEQELGDTWEWNGSHWLLHFGIPSPSPRRFASLAYDSDRGRSVLYGGYTSTGSVEDTWEWNGTAWTDLQIPGGGLGNGIRNLAYDRDRGVMVGWDASQNETWEYVAGPGVQASFATFGSGCAGPAGVVTLDSAAGSLPRIGTVFQLQLTGLPMSPFNVPIGFFGFDATSWSGVPLPVSLATLGFPGCQAWIAPAAGATLAYSGFVFTNAGHAVVGNL